MLYIERELPDEINRLVKLVKCFDRGLRRSNLSRIDKAITYAVLMSLQARIDRLMRQ